MKQLYLLIFVVLACAFSTINTSGWGITFHTEEKTLYVLLLWFFITSKYSKNKLQLGGKNKRLALLTFLSFVLIPLIIRGSLEGLTYLSMILTVYCFSQQDVSERFMHFSGYIIAVFGLVVLYVFGHTEILSGWNENQIGMIGFFSYTYYVISLSGKYTLKKITVGVVISIIYMLLLITTKSRSVIFFMFISILILYMSRSIKALIRKKHFLLWALSVPVLIAIIVVSFPKLSIFSAIENFSSQYFDKSESVNGRDILWRHVFEELPSSFYMGYGRFRDNYHNSAVAILDVFGIIGYFCWYYLLKKPLSYMRQFISDNIVFGCFVSFLVIFWQQSFEIGFVTPFPNMIPYMILGIGLGRVKTIQKNGAIYNSCKENIKIQDDEST